jgi:hypothetical protein
MKTQEQIMQEVLPLLVKEPLYQFPEFKAIVSGGRRIVSAIWSATCWVLEAMFVPHPAQKYIEEHRDRAMRMIGHV